MRFGKAEKGLIGNTARRNAVGRLHCIALSGCIDSLLQGRLIFLDFNRCTPDRGWIQENDRPEKNLISLMTTTFSIGAVPAFNYNLLTWCEAEKNDAGYRGGILVRKTGAWF
jgi:hypothetical protein